MLLLLIILIEIGLKPCTPLCDNFFPKIIGGTSFDTFVNDFDVDDNTIYSCGRTYDSGITGQSMSCGMSLCYLPLVAAADINSN
jgi:hypothetical protein